jgi:hypothetical protein
MKKLIACFTCGLASGICTRTSNYNDNCFSGKIDVYVKYPQYANIPKNIDHYRYSMWEPRGENIDEFLPKEIFEI